MARLPALGQLGGGQADRGALQHDPPERHGLHVQAAAPRDGRARGRRNEGRRQPRRSRGDAADDPRPARASSRSRSTTCRASASPRSPATRSRRSRSGCDDRRSCCASRLAPRQRLRARRDDRAPCRDEQKALMSSSHFDAIAERLRRVAARACGRALPDQAGAFRARPLPAPAAALDVGCGTGVLAERLAGRAQMTGLDPSEGMLEIMRARPGGHGRAGSGTDCRLPPAASTSC